MRSVALLVFGVHAALGVAQSTPTAPSWLPLSREVERPYATAQAAWKSGVHTAIRPYRRSELPLLTGADSLVPSALPALGRWAGVDNGRKFRWGPLLDASAGYEPDAPEPMLHRAGAGFWTDLDASPKLSFHLDAQAWSERFASYLDTLVQATQVTPGEGYAFGTRPNYTHYDWNGHVSWDPGKWFNLTLGKGKNFFGEGHRSLFLSDESYSYPYLRISTTVWRIKYINLFTLMDDIRGADGVGSDFRKKYTSMHYLSWNASKRINVALFEAIVWQQGDSAYPRGFDINYLNPVIFYRPVEYNIGSPDNALLGLALNVKIAHHVLAYSQLMLDELVMDQVRRGDGWYANKQAIQLGVVARNAFKVPGLTLRAEWNYIRPFIYAHSDTRQNYAHMAQPLAHPYGSNVQEVIAHADRSWGRWLVGVRTSMAWMGTDSVNSYGNNIFRPESDRPIVPSVGYQNYGYEMGVYHQVSLFHGELRGGWLVDPSTGTRLEASVLYRARNPEVGDQLNTTVFRVGLVCHFRERHPEQEVRYTIP